jgi:hypothetical protein
VNWSSLRESDSGYGSRRGVERPESRVEGGDEALRGMDSGCGSQRGVERRESRVEGLRRRRCGGWLVTGGELRQSDMRDGSFLSFFTPPKGASEIFLSGINSQLSAIRYPSSASRDAQCAEWIVDIVARRGREARDERSRALGFRILAPWNAKPIPPGSAFPLSAFFFAEWTVDMVARGESRVEGTGVTISG